MSPLSVHICHMWKYFSNSHLVVCFPPTGNLSLVQFLIDWLINYLLLSAGVGVAVPATPPHRGILCVVMQVTYLSCVTSVWCTNIGSLEMKLSCLWTVRSCTGLRQALEHLNSSFYWKRKFITKTQKHNYLLKLWQMFKVNETCIGNGVWQGNFCNSRRGMHLIQNI